MESRVLLCSASTFGFLSHLQKLARECGNNCSHKSVSFVSARPVGKGRISCICGGGGELRPALLLESSDLIGKPGHICVAASSSPAGGERFRRVREAKIAPVGFVEKYPTLVTGFFFFMWYFLNVIFNIINKKIYNYFPYPYFVSAVHLFVGVVYCLVSWAVGLPKRAPIDSNLLKLLIPVAVCHALGHVTINVSFAAVAVSHSYNQSPSLMLLPLSSFLGHKVALVVLGVSMASLTKLSFNWTGFISAMIANISFTYRSLYSKKAMTDMDGTNVYAYISIIALFVCIPPAIIVEGPQLMKHGFNDAIAKVGLTKFLSDLFWVGMFYHLYNQVEGPQLMKHGFNDAIAKVGLTKFLSDLFWVGMFYHLYNQMATKTLERVALLTHAVGNVLKRVFVIGFSILVFGNKISTQTGIGKAIAIAGVAIYSYIKAKMEEEKRVKLLP